MKRFFPLLLGLTLILFSFSTTNEIEKPLSEDCDISIMTAEEEAMLSLIKICRFHHVPNTNGQTCSPVAAELIVDPNCVGTVLAAITVTNLDPNPIFGNYYPLPSGQEEIYFEYTALGITQILGPFEYYKCVDMTKVGAISYYIFEAEVEMTFDVSSICPANKPSFNLNVRVIDEQLNMYDIANNAESDDIFYCQVFEESCDHCSNPPTGCNPPPSGFELDYDVLACGESCYCQGKKLQVQTNEAETLEGSSYTNTFVMENKEELSMEASPNPFSNQINLKFNNRVKSITSLQIVDMTGKQLMIRKDINVNASSLLVDMNTLPSGVYFCKVIVDNKVLTKKIIKL